MGSAADVYVDPDKKNRMEDLNRDKRVDIDDAKFLYDDIERMLSVKEFTAVRGRHGLLSGDVRASAVRARRCPRYCGAVERITQCRSAFGVAFVVPWLLRALVASETRAYSVLSHEATIDAVWDSSIRPLLIEPISRRRRATTC